MRRLRLQTEPGIVYQFGPFELHPASGELLKNGRRVRLQELPFRLLTVLLEDAGAVISREELRSRLWSDDTFVDFDSSLRVAVGKLREALEDDATAPRYVETIPKRGYRLLVSAVRRIDAADYVEARDDVEAVGTGNTSVAERGPASMLGYRSVAVLLLLIAAGGMFVWWRQTKAPPLTDKDVLILADFNNTTGDPVFDGTLRQALAVQLEQSPFLKIMEDEQVQRVARLMSLPAGAPITEQVARDICVREAAAATIDGSIASLGTSYVVTLQAFTCPGGATLAREQVQAADKEHVLSALGDAATAMRGKLGESHSSIQKFDTPLEQATTPSLEALKAYSSGIQTIGTKGPGAAIPFFQQAIDLDPTFASAYAYMGILATSALEPSLSVKYRTKAYELRDRTSVAERYWITAAYEKGVTGNIPKAIDACDLWIQAYPRSYMPHVYLAGAVLPIVGQYERAAEEATDGIRLNPDFPFPYAYRILADTSLNRFEEAKATYALAVGRKLQNAYLSLGMYNVAFAQNDAAGMAGQVAKMEPMPRWGHTMLFLEGDTAAYSGHLQQARDLSRRAIESARREGEKDAPAIYAGLSGLREISFGNAQQARRQAAVALQLSASRDVLNYAALILAYTGDDAQARRLADDLDKRFPQDTIVQFNYLPSLRAKLALNEGDVSEAVRELEAVAPYELGQSRAGDFVGISLFAVYVRGEAYLAAHQGGRAAVEFEKIIDHRGLVLNRPIGALAPLGLGRAYALEGDNVKARAAYQEFLTLWKDADPDIPILRQAKSEYAMLH